jgi:DNA-directed RNA polymerase beta subunit
MALVMTENLSYDKIFDLMDCRFAKKNVLYEHLHNSYNDMVIQIINYLEKNKNIFEENRVGDKIYRYRFKYENIYVRPPLNENGDSLLYPMDARDKNSTYSIKFIAKISQIQEIYDLTKKEIISEKILGAAYEKETAVIIPNMVRSKFCSLEINKDYNKRECSLDPGGYFVVNGSEKIVLSIEKMVENKPLVFIKKDAGIINYEVKINSRSNDPNVIPQGIQIKLKKDYDISIKVPILNEVSVFVLMRALGLETDKEIIKYIVYNEDDIDMLNILKISVDLSKKDGKKLILTKEDAYYSLTNKLRVVKKYIDKDRKLQYEEKKEHLESLFRNAFMPHITSDKFDDPLKVKAIFLGYMINKLLNCYLGRTKPDDRDSFVNKRIDMPGDLIFDLFKQYYKKMLNECNKFFKKRSGGNHETPLVIINQIKPSIIEQGIKSAMLTGNWGKKKGVAQMYPRLTYLQSCSFLRRIDAPSSDTTSSKLTGPRHYHPSQAGFLCLVGDTEILMSDGTIKLIKDVKNGDSVKSVNIETLEVSDCQVKNYFSRLAEFITYLKLENDNTLKCTPDHEIYTVTHNGFSSEYKMLRADNLKTGDIVVCYDKYKKEISESKIVEICQSESELVYDYETSNSDHTIVGNGLVLHNCVVESPEHSNIGLVKHLSMLGSITIGSSDQANILHDTITTNKNFIHMNNHSALDLAESTKIFLNGEWLGFTKNPLELYNELRMLKTNSIINRTNSVIHDLVKGEIKVYTDSGRLFRPVLNVKNRTLMLNDKIIDEFVKDKKILNNLNKWDMLMMKYPEAIDILDSEEQYYALVARSIKEVTQMKSRDNIVIPDNNEPIVNRYDDSMILNYTHCEFHPSMILGILAANIPFANHNQGPRNIFSFAQMKQAMGWYTTNYRDRADISYILYHTQKPLVNTKLSKYIHTDILPCGENAVVMAGCYTGHNQDDSIVFNQTSVDRGLFRSASLKKWNSKIEKNQSTSQDDIFMKPDQSKLAGTRHAVYDKLNDKGYVPEETIVVNGDVIIGKVTPIQPAPGSNKCYKDSSEIYKSGEPAIIDRVFNGITDSEGSDMIKMRTRSIRIPKIGDKFCCFSSDHDVLTSNGWKKINEITLQDKVATLIKGNTLEYHNPTEIQEYDYDGDLYKIESNQVNLIVTPNHRMYVGNRTGNNYKIELAETIYGKRKCYKKNVENYIQANKMKTFTILGIDELPDLVVDIEAWLTFFGIWIAEGCTLRDWGILFATHKQRVKDSLENVCNIMNLSIHKHKNKLNDNVKNAWCISDKRFVSYFLPLSIGAVNKSLPEWVWNLTKEQCRTLIDGMMLGDGHTMINGTRRYDTSSTKLADDFQRLCLHAGWSCNKIVKYEAGHEATTSYGEVIKSTKDAYRLTVITSQNNPLVNKNIKLDGTNRHDSYINFTSDELKDCIRNKVYCCTVPGEGIIYVRRNGYSVWCGQSRHGQKGTIGLTMNQADMPFTEEGISPDLIINPHCIPKRMTVGQLVECLVGKVAAIKGMEADGTPFNDIDIEAVKQELEKLGYERNATEYVYCGLTGQRLKIPIFIGPTYYQRLKHLVMDKMHCLREDKTELLTLNGWKKYGEFTKDDLIATLVDGKLVYEKPKEIYYYPDFNDKLYHISNSSVDMDVTMKHRMWTSKYNSRKQSWSPYTFEYAEDIDNKHRRYKKDAEWEAPDYQFILPKLIDGNKQTHEAKQVDMNSWITFFGIWIAEGWAGESNCKVQISVNKQRVKDALYPALQILGYEYKVVDEKLTICNIQLLRYMQTYSVGAPNKYLPEWCFKLSKIQSQLMVHSMQLGDGYFCKTTTASWYSTSSIKLSDHFMQLCLHAGYASSKFIHIEAGKNKVKIHGREVINQHDIWRIAVIKTKTNPSVNQPGYKSNVQQEYTYDYKGPVFCVEVSSGVFMVRSNGKSCWTGNSRAKGPINMLTRQASEGIRAY